MSKNALTTIEDYGTVIYKCYSGSTSYGTNINEEMAKKIAEKKGGSWEKYLSDVDVRGIFIPHPKFLYGPNKVDEFRDPNEEDTVYFSLEKFIRLALECNPNVVEQLFVLDEHVLFMNDIGKELRENLRQEFITKNAFGRYAAYAWSQLKRMTNKTEPFDRNEKRQLLIELAGGNWDPKNGMHLIRLLETCLDILIKGELHTFRKNFKELLKIRNGDYSMEHVINYADELFTKLQKAMQESTIPNVPDFEKVNSWVISAVDRTHNYNSKLGIFKGSTLRILPVEYEMVDKTTMFLVSNPMIRRVNKSEAQGVTVPYKDWFTGLRTFSEFKFDKTTIEHIHKFFHQVRSCNPRHIDTIYAPSEVFLHKHSMTDEFLEKMRILPTTKRAYYTAKGYITGNMKKMEHWEHLKEKHEQLRKDIDEAKKIKKQDWEYELETLELSREKLLISKEDYKKQKLELIRKFQKWEELSKKKGNLSMYPPMEKMNNEEASATGKYGWNTILASELYHVAAMYIELMKFGKIENSRTYESEMLAIRHGKYENYLSFKSMMEGLLIELENAKEISKLGNHNHEEIVEWIIEFIQRYHKTL